MQMLREVQAAAGWVSPEVITELAKGLTLPRARVEGVATFYTLLATRPRGEYQVLFADNIIERFHGSVALRERLCAALGVAPGALRPDGRVSVGTTSCIGLSDQPASLLVNGLAIARLTVERVDAIAALIGQRAPLDQWPAELFHVDEPIRRAGLLLGAHLEPGAAVRAALARSSEALLEELKRSKLRGRGGAGFSTHDKWRAARDAPGPTRFVVCNADEGEPGTFKDRTLLRRQLDAVLDGMTVAAHAIGAQRGFIYLRGEYLFIAPAIEAALAARRAAHLLGRDVLGRTGFDFDLELHLGAGAYVCGEESALLESLEGRRGIPRRRPPYPVTHGYLQRPTVVNNVETFASVAHVALAGGARFAELGTERSTGTRVHSVSGDCARPGLYELPMGASVRELLDACGAEAPIQAVQVGGPSRTLLSPRELDRALCFEDLPSAGAFMVFGPQRDLLEVVASFARFFAHESCGFCTPCRVGTTQLQGAVDALVGGRGTRRDVRHALRLCALMRDASHCGLGTTAGRPFMQLYEKFKPTIERSLSSLEFRPTFDLDEALAPARALTGRDDERAHLEDP
ncbi:MAG: NAD(P)H-dependent oxidoreductase subunit E [Archangiaceae bacterium]|nr:NAD(P)H-dependent oxidoreductase subunit E [Archangiaceae bacterium]